MAKLVSWIGTVVLIVAITAVLLRGFGVPLPIVIREREPDGVSSAAACLPVSSESAERILQRFEPDLTNLATARAKLLYKAALDAHDLDMHDAATTYRDAILQIRTKAAELELDLRSDEGQMLMYYASAVGQRLLALEIFGELPVAPAPSR